MSACCCGLKLDPRPQLIQIGRDAGHVSLVGVTQQHLAGRFQRPGVVHLAGGGDGVQISRGHLLDHLAARRHSGEVGRAFRRAGRLPGRDDRAGEEHLAKLNLALGQVVAGDLREARRQLAAGKERQKLLDGAGAKAHRDQILLVDAEVAGQRDGGQKVLQRLVLLPLERFFAVFGFLQAQIVLEAERDGIVQRELEGLIVDRPRGHAAEEGVGGGCGVWSLRVENRRARQSQGRKNGQRRPPKDRLLRSNHSYYSLR